MRVYAERVVDGAPALVLAEIECDGPGCGERLWPHGRVGWMIQSKSTLSAEEESPDYALPGGLGVRVDREEWHFCPACWASKNGLLEEGPCAARR